MPELGWELLYSFRFFLIGLRTLILPITVIYVTPTNDPDVYQYYWNSLSRISR